ncbi:hypothetical protein CYV26_06510, partial [Carnobacterium maltaromaticum]
YTLVSVPTNQTGTFGSGDVTVEYVYKANDYKLISTFKDENGKELLKPVIDKKTYTINEPYKTSEVMIPGYKLVSDPTNQTGTFGAGDVFVHKKDLRKIKLCSLLKSAPNQRIHNFAKID